MKLFACPLAVALVILAPPYSSAQVIPGPRWYRSAAGMLGTPAANADAREILRMERYLGFGVPYCSGLAAAQYATNMAMARNMSAYLGSVSTAAADPEARAAWQDLAAAAFSALCAAVRVSAPGAISPVPALSEAGRERYTYPGCPDSDCRHLL